MPDLAFRKSTFSSSEWAAFVAGVKDGRFG